MRENQNVEYKLIWRDEYLRWVCAFANTTGGVIYIGVDDNGKVVGVNNSSELVYMIPHKIKDYLGILVETSIKRKKNKEYLCIKVEAHNYPVSLRGRYYLRSGSNTYEAMGAELDRLILKKLGIRWEKLSGHHSSINDLDSNVIDYFKDKAIQNKTLNQRQVDVDNETLLKNLRLYNGKELSFAALLLFGKDPEEWVYNSFVKICEVSDIGTILRCDKISGSIIIQLEETLKILYKKYLKDSDSLISKNVMREIIMNALMHKAYDALEPIQISVYKNKVTVYNPSLHNGEITNENIFNPHPTIPHNPRIANTFNKCGLATLWGLGIERIKEESYKSGKPLPKFRINENSFLVRCNYDIEYLKGIKKHFANRDLSKEDILRLVLECPSISDDDIKMILHKRGNRNEN